jgi:mannosyltransferase
VIFDRAHFSSLRRLRIEAVRILQSDVMWRFAPFASLAVATILLAYISGHQSYWMDEAYSLKFARLPLDQLRAATTHVDAVFLFYYVLLHFWLTLVPPPVGGRIFSGLCALLSLPFVYAIGARLYERRTALAASLLYASTYAFLEPAREVRMYPLLTAAVAASWFCLLTVFERPTLVRGGLYAACLGLSLWIHPFAAFTVLAQVVMILGWSRQRKAAVVALVSVTLAGAAAVPLLLLARHDGTGQIGWLTRPSAGAAWEALLAASGTVPAILGIVLIVWSGVTIVQERQMRRVALLAWLLIPPAAAFAVSMLAQPIFNWRYLVEIGPAASLLIAAAVMRLSLRKRVVAATLLAAISVYEVHRLTEVANEDWWSVRTIIASKARSEEPLILYPSALSFSYRLAQRRELRSAPPLRIVYPAGAVPVWSTFHDDSTATLAGENEHSVWVVVQDMFRRQVDAALMPRYRRILKRDVGTTVTIEHWIRRQPHKQPRALAKL